MISNGHPRLVRHQKKVYRVGKAHDYIQYRLVWAKKTDCWEALEKYLPLPTLHKKYYQNSCTIKINCHVVYYRTVDPATDCQIGVFSHRSSASHFRRRHRRIVLLGDMHNRIEVHGHTLWHCRRLKMASRQEALEIAL
jgi:hypothetical protein